MARMEGHGRDGVCSRHHSLRDVCVVMSVLGATVRVMAAVAVRARGFARGLARGLARVGAKLRRDGMSTYNASLANVGIVVSRVCTVLVCLMAGVVVRQSVDSICDLANKAAPRGSSGSGVVGFRHCFDQ